MAEPTRWLDSIDGFYNGRSGGYSTRSATRAPVQFEMVWRGREQPGSPPNRGKSTNLVMGGGRPEGESFAKGFWFAPTVFTDVRPGMAILRDETFGPVSPILPVATLDEALSQANDTRYGLSAYLFTNDYRIAMRAAQEIEFGEIYINRPMGEALQAHHIGHKESGLGGEDGKYGVLKYTQLKTVYHHYA